VTLAISSFGTLLKIGDGATPEAYVTIAEVGNITGPALSLDTDDATSHDSVDGWTEAVGTLLNGGEVGMDLNFIPAGATHSYATGLIHDMVGRTLRNFRLVFPNVAATTWTFAAFVTKFAPKAPVKGSLTAAVTLKISGKPTLM